MGLVLGDFSSQFLVQGRLSEGSCWAETRDYQPPPGGSRKEFLEKKIHRVSSKNRRIFFLGADAWGSVFAQVFTRFEQERRIISLACRAFGFLSVQEGTK